MSPAGWVLVPRVINRWCTFRHVIRMKCIQLLGGSHSRWCEPRYICDNAHGLPHTAQLDDCTSTNISLQYVLQMEPTPTSSNHSQKQTVDFVPHRVWYQAVRTVEEVQDEWTAVGDRSATVATWEVKNLLNFGISYNQSPGGPMPHFRDHTR